MDVGYPGRPEHRTRPPKASPDRRIDAGDPSAGPRGQTAEHWLLRLQRSAGNAAVAHAIGRPAVQRFVGAEHKQLGDSTNRTIDLGNGVVLSFGDLVALSGDEYATVDELVADTRTAEGRARLLAAIRDDHIPDPVQVGLPEPTADQRSERFRTFLGLAAENVAHFNDAGEAVAAWRAGHATALDQAVAAGLGGDAAQHQLALAREAFAEHYLTDAFSGGHIRTPRPDIIGWYRANFGAPVVDEFISRISNRLIEGLVAQISPQTNWPDFIVRRRVRETVGTRLAAAIAAAGGRAKINDYFALGVAGVVSGPMHDLEGRRGVIVSSQAHPEPWVAYGDAHLGDSPTSRQEAETAILTATAQIDQAYDIGRRHRSEADVANAPALTHFGFGSAELTAEGTTAVTAAARYLHARPAARVTLTGHTDPTGSDAYNADLGRRRAETVARALIAGGALPEQILTFSAGEGDPVTKVPAQFRLNRRVTFDYAVRPGPYRDVAAEEAATELAAAVPPPYPAVTRFVPTPLPANVSTPAVGASLITAAQVDLENWRWGSIPPTLRTEINTWIQGYGGTLRSAIAGADQLNDTVVDDYTIRPRLIVTAAVDDLLADPAGFLEQATGRPMSP